METTTQAERIETARAALEAVQRKHGKGRGYDPGLPGRVIPEGHGRYLVESFKNSDHWYSVDLNERTCTCPNFIYRRPEAGCKHLHLAAFESYKAARTKAERL